jgi:hypothetical protein
MIVWLNGTFGAGKTTTADLLLNDLPDARIFDAEQVGYMLRGIGGLPALGDFQHWPPWRTLVAETARQVLSYVGGTLIIPQTVLVEDYWTEIHHDLTASGIEVRHFVLHAETATLRRRIEQHDEHIRAWRLNHLDAYQAAMAWLNRAGEVVDTTDLTPKAVAQAVRDRVLTSAAGS